MTRHDRTHRTHRNTPTTMQKVSGCWYQNEHGIWHRKPKETAIAGHRGESA